MDKRYVIERVRTDLRNEIYDLMTHVGYHALEKELTESLLQSCALYTQMRSFTTRRSISAEEKNQKRTLFAYLIFREMNAELGGFHFNRFESLSTGMRELSKLNELAHMWDFDEFLRNYDRYTSYINEPEFDNFIRTKQAKYLESSIAAAIKKNTVIPNVARAIGQDIVDALRLNEEYSYIRVDERMRQRVFTFPEIEDKLYISLRKISITVDGHEQRVLLKRTTRNSDEFRFLLTDFGALIKGNPPSAIR